MEFNCYAYQGIGLRAGIPLQPDGTFRLGESGRARSETIVAADPAVIDSAHRKVFRAGLARTVKLITSVEGDPAIVAVWTHHAYTRGCIGWVVAAGAASIVATGRWADGGAGNIGSGGDALVVARPGSVIVALFAGGIAKGGGRRLVYLPSAGGPPMECDVDLRVRGGAADIGTWDSARRAELLTLTAGFPDCHKALSARAAEAEAAEAGGRF